MIENLQDTLENGWNQQNEHEDGRNHQQKTRKYTKNIAKISENKLHCPNHKLVTRLAVKEKDSRGKDSGTRS